MDVPENDEHQIDDLLTIDYEGTIRQKDATIEELSNKIDLLETQNMHLTLQSAIISLCPISSAARLEGINQRVTYLIDILIPSMNIMGPGQNNTVEEISMAVNTVLLKWTSAMTFQQMLPGAHVGGAYLAGLCYSHARPMFSFANYQKCYNLESMCPNSFFSAILQKFDMRLLTFRQDLYFLNTGRSFETVVHGYLATTASLYLFHLFDPLNFSYRYPLSSPVIVDYDNERSYQDHVLLPNNRDIQPAMAASGQNLQVLDLDSQRARYQNQRKRPYQDQPASKDLRRR